MAGERAATVPYTQAPPAPSAVAAQDGSGAGPMNIQVSPNAFGANVGAGLEKFGSSVEEVAQHFGTMAVHTNVNDQYVNGYAPQVNSIVSDYKKLSGTEALEQLPVYQQKLKDLNQQYLSSGGGLQQELMGQLVARHTTYTMNDLSNHADQQFAQHEQIVNTQSMKNAGDEAANNWQNPDVVDFNVNRAMGLSKLNYTRKVGYDPQSQAITDQMSKEDASHVVTSAIDMALNNRDSETANFYKNKYSDILSGKDKLSVEKSVSSLNVENNAGQMADNLLGGLPAVPAGTRHYDTLQTKADIANLAQKENFDPNIAFALHGTESDYGRGIKPESRLKDDFQTDPKYRDKGYEDDSLASSMHNGAKIWNANSDDLTKRLGRSPSVTESYLAYNQGGAGAEAILKSGSADTAVQALAKIMPVDEAKAHVLQNGGTVTMSASDFSQHIQGIFQNHYDTQKTTASGDLPDAIRAQANLQMPAIQRSSNPHQYFEQIDNALPAAQAQADAVPDDKTREALQKQLKLKYETAKLGDTAWKNTQAETANKFGEDPRYTSMDQVPVTVRNNLQEAGQLGSLERQLNDKRNPKKDNTYGDSAYLSTLGRLTADGKDPDAITDLAGLQKAYADTPDLHSSGFKQLQGLIKNIDTPEGKATAASQFQFLSDLRQKMVAGDSDAEGKKAFEAALPQFFRAYGAGTEKGNLSDVLSLDPKNANSFVSTLKVPSSAELTSKKIQDSTSFLSKLFGGGSKTSSERVQYTPQEQVMSDFVDGRITAAEKDAQLKNLGVSAGPQVPRPE